MCLGLSVFNGYHKIASRIFFYSSKDPLSLNSMAYVMMKFNVKNQKYPGQKN